jgi:hypothetical protein
MKSDLKMTSLNVNVIIPEINPHCILSKIYALLIEFYYAFFLFLFFKDMHYNTMIRTKLHE